MYGVILMAAMTTGGEVPAWHHRRGGHGCYGCTGCYGCSGCWGGNGCWGGCHGCYGAYPYAGIGYYGYGCWGYGCNGCAGCYGCYGGWTGYGGCYCTGTPHVFSMVPIAPNGPVMPTPPVNGDQNPEKDADKNAGKNDKEGEKKGGDFQQISLNPDRARLIVTLPADAKLFVDGQAMKTPAERRVFQSPQLAPGQYYYYNLRVEVVRDGRTITREQRVLVQGGRVTQAAFADLSGAPVSGPVLAAQAGNR
jgi:uncharacterized protein (TIGR03000 family)